MLRADSRLSLEVQGMEGFWARRRKEPACKSSGEKCLKACLQWQSTQALGRRRQLVCPLSVSVELRRALREPSGLVSQPRA